MQYKHKLKELRELHKLTQKEVGALINTSQQHYRLYEIGERSMPIEHYITLSKYYKVSIDYMVGNEEQQKEP